MRTGRIPGFKFSGVSSGIKEKARLDLALIRSNPPATVVGCFTQNKVQAAPVVVSQRNIRSSLCSAVIINSGNANACTGTRGLRDAETMVRVTARALGVPTRQVLVCSTGKIGVPLPIGKISGAIPKAASSLSPGHFMQAARAILTTDRGPKTAFFKGRIGGRQFLLAGFAKGAGMIEPHMATMLAFIMTDLRIGRPLLQQILKRVVDQTFNRITVDGDSSTNDTALLLANGLAGNAPLRSGSRETKKFEEALCRVMEQLAFRMVEDGEGATKRVKIEVKGAKSAAEAREIAYTIGRSPLVKTSFFGEDPNWGRVIAAAGRSGATLDPRLVDIYYEEVPVVRRGRPVGKTAEEKAKRAMKKRCFNVTVSLNVGDGDFWIWASDLTVNYVKLNAEYRT